MIHKAQKDPKNVNSYRPISLLNTLSKLLERVITNRLNSWIYENKILSDYQSGFRKTMSTKDHLLRLTQECQQAFNRNKSVGALFVDIEKAFDKVWINGLIYKLYQLNLPKYLGCWIKNYLNGRSFQVRSRHGSSSSKKIRASVPQGSITGPVLFLIFFNDITNNFINLNSISLALYADDLAAWTASEYLYSIEKNLQLVCDAIYKWSIKWRTCVSILKTVVTIFNKNGKSASIRVFLGENQIEYEKNPKLLGIIFDQGLNFSKHVDSICVRTQRRLSMLANMRGKRWGLSSQLLITAYKVLVRSIFDYSSFVLISIAPPNLKKINMVQNRAIRIATYWPPGYSTSQMLKITHLDSLYLRSICLSVNYLNKSLAYNNSTIEMFIDYIMAYQVNEGAITKTHKVIRRTIIGKIVELPPIVLNKKRLTATEYMAICDWGVAN